MMKKFTILAISLFLATISGCLSTKSAKSDAIPPFNSVKLIENLDYISAKLNYPSFMDKKLEGFSESIKRYVEKDYNSFKTAAKKEFNGTYKYAAPFSYDLSSKIFQSGNLTSVLITKYFYSGGAHGNCLLESFNFDSKLQKYVGISEVTGMDAKSLSEAVRKKLYERGFDREMVNEGTTPVLKNFSTFTVSGSTVTIYFEPYQVAAYSEGTVTVDLPKK